MTIPSDVLGAYFGEVGPDFTDRVRKIGNGMVNLTLLVNHTEGNRGLVVLQRLSGMFDEGVVEDATVVAGHLAGQGWEVPETVLTRSGDTSIRDRTRSDELPQGWLWRATTFIECETPPNTTNQEEYRAVGALLGRFHQSLRGLEYQPKYAIDHFHDTEHHIGELRRLQDHPEMPTWAKEMAADVLTDYERLPAIPAEASMPQLIHGDPRTGNMLFRDGEPFTLIDFDTFMVHPIWTDLGDLIRSLVEDAAEKGGELPLADIRQVVDGYRTSAELDYDPDEFFAWSLTAAQRITLELTSRFLNDTVVPYFAPDADIYPTRHHFDLARATLQRRVYNNLDQPQQG